MSKTPPVVFDDDNPEWTAADFARARPASQVLPAEAAAALVKNKGGRPKGSDKTQIALRVDNDTLDRFKASGAGWQSRMNDALRKAAARL